MTTEVDRMMREIIASRPRGHFDETLGLLRTYCETIGKAGGSCVNRLLPSTKRCER
jgi:hypothetical protein